ncbi:MAG: AAA family ATPase [Pseudomonadota bacterium]
MPRRGLTLGKFMPLHHGHALLLRAAALHCDELTVLVGMTPDDPYDIEQRMHWIDQLLSEFTDDRLSLTLVADPDPDPNVTKDADGTVVDEAYWAQWLSQNAEHLNDIDHVFTSDRYGQQIAERIDARWFPVDPDREVVPITATNIRTDRFAAFSFVHDVAKPDVCLTVAVVGAESTGKSTLVKHLAEHYDTHYAPEWGRIISEAHSELTTSDFDAIVTMQCEMIRSAQRLGNGLCFTDTEAITTALFAPIYLGHEHAPSQQQAIAQQIDLYLLLDVSVPWIDDGTRVLDHDSRQRFHTALMSTLENLNKPFQLIGGESHSQRQRQAVAAVDALLSR